MSIDEGRTDPAAPGVRTPPGEEKPVQVSPQKGRQGDGNWTPLRVLVFGLGLAGVAFVVTYALGY